MNCPNCEIPLMMAERKGIEIDFCTQCRGIWLDRGELDKIIEVTAEERAVSPKPKPEREAGDIKRETHTKERKPQEDARTGDLRDEYRQSTSNRSRQYVEERDREKYKDKERYRSKRKKSTLARLIDFLD